MSHPRAKLTVHGRQLLVERVLELGWTVPMAAEAQGCSSATATSGSAGSRPRDRVASGIVRVGRTGARLGSAPAERQRSSRGRHATLEGPHRIAWALREAPSTVHRVLRRLGAPRLRDLDRPTRTIVRYERERRASSSTST